MGEEERTSGGDPEGFGMCTGCQNVYTVQQTTENQLRPMGTNGTCECGNTEFVPYTDP